MVQKDKIKKLCKVYMDDEFNSAYDEDAFVDNLELLIQRANEYHAEGRDLMPVSAYTTCVELLRELCPDSGILDMVWTKDTEAGFDEDYDVYLVESPIKSKRVVTDYDDVILRDFEEALVNMDSREVEMHVAFNLVGRVVRAVYVYGELTKATIWENGGTGRDITKQFNTIMGSNVPEWEEEQLIEVRGMLVISMENFGELAEKYPNVKTPYAMVSALLNANVDEEDTALLSYVATDVMGIESADSETLSGVFAILENAGFEIPYSETVVFNTKLDIIKQIEDKTVYMAHVLDGEVDEDDDEDVAVEPYAYFTDGLVFTVNNKELYTELGGDATFDKGAVLLKLGRWVQDLYEGVIEHIEWSPCGDRFMPIAVLEDEGVITANGNKVSVVPLYAPLYVLLADAYAGNTIYFKFAGDKGVMPCTSEGKLLRGYSVTDVLSDFVDNVEETLNILNEPNISDETIMAMYKTW